MAKRIPSIEQLRNELRFTLSEQLVLDATLSSIERTFLAYLRTAFALIAVGLAFAHLIDHYALNLVGVVSIIIGLILSIVSWIRCAKLKLKLNHRLFQYARSSSPEE